MAYSTSQDVLASWPKVYTTGFTTGELEGMIARGDAVIDAYIGRRYVCPVVPTPPLLKTLSQDLCMLDVFDRTQGTPDFIIRRLERDMEILQGLADGTLALVGADGSLVAERDTGGVLSSTSGYVPTFGVAPSLTEDVDPNRADDEEDARDGTTDTNP